MSSRKLVSVSDETWECLEILKFLSGKPQGGLVAEALASLLGRDPSLAAHVKQVRAARATTKAA